MQDLFMNKPTSVFEKTAAHALSPDTTKWVKEIITHFLEKYPNLQNAGLNIEWKRKDANKGYAVGILRLGNSSIPVIVNDFKLAPMDVVLIGGNTYPLNAETINTMLASPEAFQGVAPGGGPGKNLSMFGLVDNSAFQNYGAGTGREGVTYSERPAIKLASFIEKVSNVRQEDVDKVLQTATEDPIVMNQFIENGNADVLDKIASIAGTNEESFAESLLRGITTDRHLVCSDDYGNYILKEASSKIDYVWETKINPEDIGDLAKYASAETPQENINLVDDASSFEMYDTKGVLYITKNANWTKFDDTSVLNSIPTSENHKVAEATPTKGSFGTWKLGDKVTDPFEIINIEKIASPASNANSYSILGDRGTLYVNDKGDYEIKEASDRNIENFDVDGSEPMLGDTGTFIIDNKATNPFEIVSLQKTAGEGNYEVVGYDGLQKISYYPLKVKSPEITKHETIKNAYYIPGNAVYVKLSGGKMHKGVADDLKKSASLSQLKITVNKGREVEHYYPTQTPGNDLVNHLDESNSYYLPKEASFIPLNSEISVDYTPQVEKVSHYIGRDAAGLYYLSGPEFDKYASLGHQTRDLSKQDATWALIHCNGSDGDVKKAASLNYSEVGAVRSAVQAPQALKDLETVISNEYEKIAEDMDKIKVDLIKEASVLEDKATVDAVLSLNLLNKENLVDYINLAPNLEKTASDLAKTLVTVRMGLSHIPEGAVKTAMESVSQVARVLRQLEAVMSNTK